jgi:hypothetical protein
MEEDNAVQLGQDVFEERKEEEELEEDEAENRIPLEECQLGGAQASEEYNTDFAKAKFKGTPQILFIPEGATSEPALTPLRRGQ